MIKKECVYKMLELVSYNNDSINTRTRVTIELIKEGEEFLRQFEINQNLLLDSISIVYKYLEKIDKIPHNLFKFFIAAYYIVSRHPIAFPVHESKKEFCQKFGVKQSSLDYSVEKIVFKLSYIKILDDMNYPYYIDSQNDIGFNLIKKIVKTEVDKTAMRFFINHQLINSQILTEDLISKIIFNMSIYPEELFRQFYQIVFELVEKSLHEYYYYINLQQKYLI